MTTWSPDDVIITWSAPDNGGSPILGYVVYIRQSDGSTFTTDSVNCDASVSLATTCTVPVSSLKAEPYSLDWGVGVYVKVLAFNLYGNSDLSLEGNGAIITTTPDAPINLAEDYSQRTKDTLAITWEQAAFNGGAVIEDYRVSMAEADGAFAIIASGLTDSTHTITGLTAGLIYHFKVESRNSYSYSLLSEVLSLPCAFISEVPTSVTTTNSAD